MEQAQEQAEYYNVGFENELFRLVAHGFYHLLGYDDQSRLEKQKMTELEDSALEYLYLKELFVK